MKSYQNYRSSEVIWIDQIPDHWNDTPAQHLLTHKRNNNVGGKWGDTQLLSLTQRGIIKGF